MAARGYPLVRWPKTDRVIHARCRFHLPCLPQDGFADSTRWKQFGLLTHARRVSFQALFELQFLSKPTPLKHGNAAILKHKWSLWLRSNERPGAEGGG